MINYKKLSITLGLHKDSYNYLSKVQSLNRIQNISKLRKLYQQNELMKTKIKNPDFDILLNSQKALAEKNYNSTHGLAKIDEYNLKDA